MKFNIREFRSDDIELYLEGEIDTFKLAYPDVSVTENLKKEFKDNILRSIGSGDSMRFTLEVNLPIGFIVMGTHYVFNIPAGYIKNIYVKAEERKKGYARKLLKFAEDFCKKEGCRILQFDVSIHHEAAHKLYESESFTIVNYKMEKDISP